MKTEDIPTKQPAPWIPEADLHTVAIVGKLGEEASELAAKCFRVLIQGWEEKDPDDGRPNWEHVRDEVADVEALIDALKRRMFDIHDRQEIAIRAMRKGAFKAPWFDFLRGKRRPD